MSGEQLKVINRHIKHSLLLLQVLVFVSACTSIAPKVEPEPVDLNKEASKLIRQGNYSEASSLYSKLANSSLSEPEKQNYLLLAAEALIDNGLYRPDGRLKLNLISDSLPSPALQNRLQILKAKEALINQDPVTSLKRLPKPERVNSRKHLARMFVIQADAFEAIQKSDEELNARVNLHLLLSSQSAITANQKSIWNLLDNQSLNNLRRMTTKVHGDTYQGWLELALILRSQGFDAKNLTKQINNWRQRFVEHPASSPLLNERLALTLESIPERAFADNIAVLLPLTGDTANVASSIRDGFISAYLENSDATNLPQIRFYDSATPDFLSVYKQAVQEGANLIVGPLKKQSVIQLTNKPTLPVPTLALNYYKPPKLEGLSGNLIQFGLLPEDEAMSAALKARQSNYERALIISSDEILSDRLSQAFNLEFERNGGITVDTIVLPKESYDYSKQLRTALKINQSNQRHRSLQGVLATKLKFEPVIRQDIDVIYLATDEQQARLIRPQLLFFHAKNIPLLASSRLNKNAASSKKTRDLDGVTFSEIAWSLTMSNPEGLLQKAISTSWPDRHSYANFFALGADAYNLIPYLQKMKNDTDFAFPGNTGMLSIEDNYRVRRNLSWASFEKSIPVLIRNNSESIQN